MKVENLILFSLLLGIRKSGHLRPFPRRVTKNNHIFIKTEGELIIKQVLCCAAFPADEILSESRVRSLIWRSRKYATTFYLAWKLKRRSVRCSLSPFVHINHFTFLVRILWKSNFWFYRKINNFRDKLNLAGEPLRFSLPSSSHNESFWSARVYVRHSDKTEVYVIFKTNTTKAPLAAGQMETWLPVFLLFQIW